MLILITRLCLCLPGVSVFLYCNIVVSPFIIDEYFVQRQFEIVPVSFSSSNFKLPALLSCLNQSPMWLPNDDIFVSINISSTLQFWLCKDELSFFLLFTVDSWIYILFTGLWFVSITMLMLKLLQIQLVEPFMLFTFYLSLPFFRHFIIF